MAIPNAQKSVEQARAYTKLILQTMITLASGALGFVAALAWNEAIKAAITKIFGTDESLSGLFTYAIIATLIAVIVVLVLSRVAARIGGEAAITREVD
jgi:hypothetical protein